MKSIVNSLVLFQIVILASSCSKPKSLVGDWSVSSIRQKDPQTNKVTTLYIADSDSLRKILNDSYIEGCLMEESKVDIAEMISNTESTLAYFQNARLKLSENKKVEMISNGLIIPKAIPGWHLGDTLIGYWDQINDTELVLKMGDSANNFPINFQAISIDKKTMTLKLQGGNDQTRDEIIMIRK
ncbi:MAG: hypothetical protein V4722_17030 [Bacteroidota bacterium]